MTDPVVRAAVIQAAPVMFDTAATIAKLDRLAGEAAAQGASLAVFPEAFVGGYPKGWDFGARLGSRSPEGREAFRQYFESAIEVPGPDMVAIARIAHRHRLYLVVGVIERDGATLYCSALTFGPDGSLLSRHRKLLPTALERLVWGFGDGSTLDVAETGIGRMGSVICWENYMPLLRTAMYAQGIELYCAPTVDDRDCWLPSMQMIALEGRCFVLSACQYLTHEDLAGEAAVPADTPLIRGGSCIVDPLGTVLAGPEFGREAILTASLDRRLIAQGKFDLDVVGHYARPDIFELRVNRVARRPVTFHGTDSHDPSAKVAEEGEARKSCSD